jgi:Icc-related predicted phosphoesterase
MEFTIAHISDTHNKEKYVKIPKCDLLIHSGDISSFGEKERVESFLKWFARQNATYKIFIVGNHDMSFVNKPYWLQEALAKFQEHDALNFYLENSGCEIEGIKFWGTPNYCYRPNHAFHTDRGADLVEVYSKIPFDTDVLITHGPPYGKLDYVLNAHQYIGSEELRYAVKKIKPKFHLFGHIHECYGRDWDESTIYLNGSTCTTGYEPINQPHVFNYHEDFHANYDF